MSEIYVQKVKFKHWGEPGMVQLAWDKTNGRYYKGTPTYDNWTKRETIPIETNNNFLNEGNPIVLNTDDDFPF